ncbi:stage IV sporulation protein FB [Natronincola peptidivorans]|uniref:Stage IV sporulation protein FB n=1 Tax=Natronincola peptidivorans TaxID=426128 RepID=A0A1H9YZX3_9FIRM|nr:site-2 protease family protein [Natronincola peptidivorans]SES74715.1 stage IV sporulation protein FB [Natronincola peptidivorans]
MRLFKLFDIYIKINYMMIPILIFSLYFEYFIELVIVIFIIIIHELAHSLVSIYSGIKVVEIELFPFGGVAKTENYFEIDSFKEIVIAIIGPASNYVMLFMGIIAEVYMKVQSSYLYFFIVTNLTIGLFNTLPILPLDGGRILRAYLNSKIGFKKATIITIKLSKILTVFIFFMGIYFGVKSTEYFFLCGIAVFLFIKVDKEREKIGYTFIYQVVMKKKKLIEKGIMDVKYLTALETLDLNTILYELSSNKYHFIAVINTKGKVTGNLSESQILDAIIRNNNKITLKKLLETIEK